MIKKSSLSIYYVPCSSYEEAKNIAMKLLESKDIACANILTGSKSLYFWEGKIEESEESLLLLKIQSGERSRLEAKIRELHSYKVPCIMELEAKSINADFLKWALDVQKPQLVENPKDSEAPPWD